VPYNTIIEQNAAEFEKLLAPENVLQHHSGVTYDDSGEEMNRKRYSTENWDFPVVVTSSVRFFESLFSNRPSDCRKLHNIADSVIVFDEAQMLPVPYLIPCVKAIRELIRSYGCTAVLATATQSALEPYFGDIKPTEITEAPDELYTFLKRVTIRQMPDPLTDDELAVSLGALPQTLCIVNTRRHAQTLFQKLRRLQPDGTFHLSTTMYPEHRSRVLAEIRERLRDNLPCRVVSTSLVEAGVDLDFPTVYRAEAGLDSVIQAAGRCNREGKRCADESFVYVFKSSEHKAPDSIKFNIAATIQATRGREDIASPDVIKAYFEQLFYNKGDKELDRKGIVPLLDSGLSEFSFPLKMVADKFNIIENDTKTVYVLTEVPELEKRLRSGERTRELFRALGRYSVSLYEADYRNIHTLGWIERIETDSEILLLQSRDYDNDFGISLTPEGGKAIIVEKKSPGYGFKTEIWGEYACFSRPELKVERVSYEVITPSAARGILEAVMWKPAIKYVIDEIAVCSPIRFENIRRNEVNSKASAGKPYIAATDDRAQRAAMVLRDVRYVVTAHFEMTDKAGEADNEGKFADMIKRRLKSGQHFHMPYLGTREFPANIRLIENGEQPPTPIDDTRSLGLMLYDIDYIKHTEKVKGRDASGKNTEVEIEVVDDWISTYFMAELDRGVIDLRKVEVLR
jgi:CRISPR-associated endonuclease/helicase Cas3